MWNKIFALSTIALLAAAVAMWLIPTSVFSPDTDFGKSYFVLSNRMESTYGSDVITAAATDEKVVALTFDDGPDPKITPQVLKILKRHDIKATFFVVGEDAAINPDLVLQELSDGHEIENHTYTHPDLLKNTDLTAGEEITWNHQVVGELTKRSPIYFRPPKKLFNKEIVQMSQLYGYRIVLWTVCVESRYAKTPQAMADRVLKYTTPGSIILAHDGHLDRTQTVKALPLIIERLKKEGYKFVTLEELLTVYNKNQPKPPITRGAENRM
ncbi:MAG: polysaccharide deacetylase family protein [Ignavibacteriales bacterium]